MTEGDSRTDPAGPSAQTAARGWDLEAISHTLNTDEKPISDIRHGDGIRYEIGSNPAVGIDVFPGTTANSGTLRLTFDDAELYFYRQPPPQIGATGELVCATPRRFLEIASTGRLTLLYDATATAAQEPVDAMEGGSTPRINSITPHK